jgi:hypothetical protein
VLGQNHHVLHPLAQGRQVDGEGRQAPEQVFAERPRLYLGSEIDPAGAEQPLMPSAALRCVAAAIRVLDALEQAQQLALNAGAGVADLVERQGAARQLRARGVGQLAGPEVREPLGVGPQGL